MPTAPDLYALAFQRHIGGQFDAAEALYRRVLSDAPDHADAHHLLGVLAYQRGRTTDACRWIGRAVGLNDRDPNYHQNLALALRALGRWHEAALCYGRILALEPGRVDAYAGLGAVHAAAGAMDQALACWQAGLGIDPAHEGALLALVARLHATGRLPEAADRLRAGLRCAPDKAVFLNNLGVILRQMERLGEAEAVYHRLLAQEPSHASALYGLADARLRRGLADTARTGFLRALASAPLMPEARDGLARAHESGLRYEEAATCFTGLLALTPQDPRVWYNLGTTLENLGRTPAAVACFDRALRLDRSHALAWSKIGHKLGLCDWRDYDENAADILRHIREGGGHLPQIPLVYLPSTPADQLLSARRLIERVELPKVAGLREQTRFAFSRAPRDRLRIGYVSGDFREHAVAFLIVELLELHDRGRFEVIGYSNGPQRDQPMRRRLEAAVDRMVEVRDLPPLDAAARIHEDGVDVLIDLSGHTLHARLDVFALRPAPVQVTWLGYPGTTGADFMDAILVDPIVVPPDQQPFYSERLVHLPDCYQPNDRKRPVAAGTPTRADCGLPEEGVVFCSFNHAPKITPAVFSAWMRILAAVPGSVLWLLMPDALAQDNLRREAARRGIDPARVVFAPRWSLPHHLTRFRVADLFLDTFPYNAHTTASDSLWVGCPLLTLMGETFPSRVAASLLTNAGVPELITRSQAEYEARAVELAQRPDLLRAYRRRLEANRDTCPLFDTPRMARSVEAAYERLWADWSAGRLQANTTPLERNLAHHDVA
ncbi:hypothetical protein TSO221_05480 [Azospirillum sp. TSO22-1]|nr:hypothetical protein TSO221_05480 [Azospirillum sp. TSO22-1]